MLNFHDFVMAMMSGNDVPPQQPPSPANRRRDPRVTERNAEMNPQKLCAVGEHGICTVEGCECWCHMLRERK